MRGFLPLRDDEDESMQEALSSMSLPMVHIRDQDRQRQRSRHTNRSFDLDYRVLCVAFAESRAATGGRFVEVWEARNDGLVRSPDSSPPQDPPPRAVALAWVNEDTLCWATWGGKVVVWSCEQGRVLAEHSCDCAPQAHGNTPDVFCMAVDGGVAVVGVQGKGLEHIEVSAALRGAPLRFDCIDKSRKVGHSDQKAHSGDVTAVGRCGDVTVSGASDGSLRIWVRNRDKDFAWKELCGCERAHLGKITSVAFNPHNDKLFATCSIDRSIKVWTVGECECQFMIANAHKGTIHDVRFNRNNGRSLVTVADDRCVKVWSAESFKCLAMIEEAHDGGINAVSFSSDGERFITGGTDKKMRVWTAQLHEPSMRSLVRHSAHVHKVVSFRNNNMNNVFFTVTVSGDVLMSTVRPEGLESRREAQKDDSELAPMDRGRVRQGVSAAAVSDNGSTLLFGHQSGAVEIVCTNKELLEASKWTSEQFDGEAGHNGPVFSAASAKQGLGDVTLFATGGEDGFVKVWTVVPRKVTQWTVTCPKREEGPFSVLALAFASPCDESPVQWLVAGLRFGGVELYHLDDDFQTNLVCTVHEHLLDVSAVTFFPYSPDKFLTGSIDCSLRAWEIKDNALVVSRVHKDIHQGGIRAVEFCDTRRDGRQSDSQAPTDQLFFTASDYDGVRAWHKGTFRCRLRIAEPCSSMACFSSFLLTSHKCQVMPWDWRELDELPGTLQPTHGNQIERPLAVVLRLPAIRGRGLAEGAQQVIHVALSSCPTSGNEGYNALQFVQSSPWLAGPLMYLACLADDQRLVARLLALCQSMGALSLAPDPALSWGEVTSQDNTALERFGLQYCGYGYAIEGRKYNVVKLITDTMLEMWDKTSLAQTFTAGHLVLLLKNFPDLALRMMTSATETDPPLVQVQPPSVTRHCERAPLPKAQNIVKACSGLSPHDFWKRHFRSLEERKPRWRWPRKPEWCWPGNANANNTAPQHRGDDDKSAQPWAEDATAVEVQAVCIGVKGLVRYSREVLATASKIKDEAMAEKVFTSELMRSLADYEWAKQASYVWTDFAWSLMQAIILLVLSFDTSLPLGARDVFVGLLLFPTLWFAWQEVMWLRLVKAAIVRDLSSWINTIGLAVIAWYLWARASGDQSVHVVLALAVLAAWLKLLVYMRVFRPTSFLISALAQIIRDMTTFLCVMAITIIGFTNAFFVIFQRMGDREDATDLATWHRALLTMYAAMLGEFELSLYTDSNTSHQSVVTVLFCIYMFFVFVLMLNVAIAIIGDSFDRVQSRQNIEHRMERAHTVLKLGYAHREDGWLQVLRRKWDTRSNRGWSGKIGQITRTMADTLELRFSQHREWMCNSFGADAPLQPRARRAQDAASASAPVDPSAPVPYHRLSRLGRYHSLVPADSSMRLRDLAMLPCSLEVEIEAFESRQYRLSMTNPSIKHQVVPLFAKGVVNKGDFSPPSPIEEGDKSGLALHRPSNATSFVIAYPLKGVEFLSLLDKNTVPLADPNFGFMLHGGLVFLDKDNQPVHANAFLSNINAKVGLLFEGPFKWPSNNNRRLNEQSLLQPVSISALSNEGVKHYAWVRCGEVLEGVSEPLTHGGFVYKFGNDPLEEDRRDCLFAVVCQKQSCCNFQGQRLSSMRIGT